ncbi:MAG: rubrerythrin [Candidatus Paraimprobicoccus trichonymphae]|uniref:Rubrerythrin n=1 Tax=Candidatus Paraimprobicoccus trichonymphae TaxID=3033793 RepID=A0AA48I2H4_9FIRM|nr:MAG: rubrerythrin [Candidatus Paraimprobicoccus trichonymphae]
MSLKFENSITKINLMKAFAGESQARNRYTFMASKAKNQNLNIIEKICLFTANQEKEHAKIFYNYLKNLNNQNIDISSAFPVNLSNDVLDLLKSAIHNEFEEYSSVYKNFSSIAKEENFKEISESFYSISKIEKIHYDRFKKLINLLETDSLFKSEKETTYICLNCGHVHYGKEAPKICSVCSHSKGYFLKRGFFE